MYRAFTDVKMSCRAANGCFMLNEIFRQDLTTFSFSLVQRSLPPYKDNLLHLMKGFRHL